MELGELITLYRKQAGLTIDELSERANVPKGTLNKIIGGITKAPTLETMRSIAYALGKKLADFDDEPNISMLYSPAEGQLIKKYRTLDRHGKNAVDCILDIEIDRIVSAQRAEKEKAERKSALQNHQEDTSEEFAIYITTLYHQPVSAGNGESSGYDYSRRCRRTGLHTSCPFKGTAWSLCSATATKFLYAPRSTSNPGRPACFIWMVKCGSRSLETVCCCHTILNIRRAR